MTRDLILVGGGHSHVAVLRSFGMKPMPGVRLTLVARDVHTPYSGMLPGLIAGHYEPDETHVDLRPLCRFAGARLLHDEATGLDLAARTVLCRDHPPVPYDLLSIDIGSRPDLSVPGAAEHVVPVKPIDRFLERWNAVQRRLLASTGPVRIGIVGTGAGGVELTLAVRHRLRRELAESGGDPDRLHFVLVGDAPEVLPSYNARVRSIFARILAERGVETITGVRVTEVQAGRLLLADGRAVPVDEILWVTAAAAAAWLRGSGLDLDEKGFIRVAPTLQSLSHPEVHACGDVAAVVEHPRPKAGVFAVRQGPPLAENLRHELGGREPRPFEPQKAFLSLISTGDRYAVAARGQWATEGAWVWRWKDWIDRRWMRRYRDLPEMDNDDGGPDAHGVDAVMRCAGCGGKLGGDLLHQALRRLKPVVRPDVLIGLDAPDDAAVAEVPAGRVAVHSVDFFRDFLGDPYRFGRIAAVHALADIYAMGAEPQSALAVVTLPLASEPKMAEDLFQLLAGANEAFRESHTALVGGHTMEGADLALGFSVNGLATRDALLRKAGMRPGERLILTKAIGTGTLFAADMRGRAKGRWIESAVTSMELGHAKAADVLRRFNPSACTDISGFGLAGHLLEMLRAGGVGAQIDMASLPLLDGAIECAAAGLLSSLHPANLRFAAEAAAGGTAAEALLFDPQTAGGLLAAVTAQSAEPCVAALREAGYRDAAIIGTVTGEPASGPRLTFEGKA